jgi:hypothetical protein
MRGARGLTTHSGGHCKSEIMESSSTLLGAEHPLVRAESRQRMLRAQCAVTVAFGVLAALLSPLLGPPALRLAIGAVVVAVLFAIATCVARMNLRERAFELIASGREELPLPVVESEACRLRDRRYRRSLARTIEVIIKQPDPREWWSPIYANREAVRGACAQLQEIATLLRELPTVRARGVALATRLIRDGATSPLYQGPAPRLNEELSRIRHVLIGA